MTNSLARLNLQDIHIVFIKAQYLTQFFGLILITDHPFQEPCQRRQMRVRKQTLPKYHALSLLKAEW
jgi:hypothetical protein